MKSICASGAWPHQTRPRPATLCAFPPDPSRQLFRLWFLCFVVGPLPLTTLSTSHISCWFFTCNWVGNLRPREYRLYLTIHTVRAGQGIFTNGSATGNFSSLHFSCCCCFPSPSTAPRDCVLSKTEKFTLVLLLHRFLIHTRTNPLLFSLLHSPLLFTPTHSEPTQRYPPFQKLP